MDDTWKADSANMELGLRYFGDQILSMCSTHFSDAIITDTSIQGCKMRNIQHPMQQIISTSYLTEKSKVADIWQ